MQLKKKTHHFGSKLHDQLKVSHVLISCLTLPFCLCLQITYFSFPFWFVHCTLIIYVGGFRKIISGMPLLPSCILFAWNFGAHMFLVKLYHGQFMPHFWWKQSWVAGGTYSFSEGATESDMWMCIRDTSFCICVHLCKSFPSQ